MFTCIDSIEYWKSLIFNMKISVIIPVYNEEKQILNCLESLGKQNFDDFEVIIVDDGSTDKSYEEVKNLTRIIPNLQILRQNHKGPGAARNAGAKEAEGEILVFVDADMVFDEAFIENLIAPILAGKTKGTFSSAEYVLNWDNVWARCWNINEGWEEKKRHPINYPDKQKVFRAILKKEFKKAGGFTPGGYTDDYSLYDKLGYMSINARGAIFYHENPSTLKEVYAQAKWTGKRQYKLGFLGNMIAILRSLLPISIINGVIKSLKYKNPHFLLFKITYDLGVIVGIFEYLIWKNGAK